MHAYRNRSISDAPSRAEYDPKLGTKLPKNSVGVEVEVEVEVGAMRSIQILGRNNLESLLAILRGSWHSLAKYL